MRNQNATSGRQIAFTNLQFWRAQGLSTRAATVVAAAGCWSWRDLRKLGWRYFEGQENCGKRTLTELSTFIDGLPAVPNRHGAWIRQVSNDFLMAEVRRRRVGSGKEKAW
jgi:hypothetical protein